MRLRQSHGFHGNLENKSEEVVLDDRFKIVYGCHNCVFTANKYNENESVSANIGQCKRRESAEADRVSTKYWTIFVANLEERNLDTTKKKNN